MIQRIAEAFGSANFTMPAVIGAIVVLGLTALLLVSERFKRNDRRAEQAESES